MHVALHLLINSMGAVQETSDASAVDAAEVLDICLVGAGPHGLAFLTHFLSPREHLDDSFDEHPNNPTLYNFQNSDHHNRRIKCKVTKKSHALRSKRSGREVYEHYVARASSSTGSTGFTIRHDGLKVLECTQLDRANPTRICVLDKCPGGEFMRKWDTHFDVLDIPCLRSTVHQHPDPLDLNLLVSFAYHTNRHGELVPLEISDERAAFRGPFLRPSRSLFKDFVRGLVKGFHLEGAVNCADVKAVEAVVHDGRISGFRVSYRSGGDEIDRSVIAKRVILALGHANRLSIPERARETSAPPCRLLHYEDLITTLAMSETSETGRHFQNLLECDNILSLNLNLNPKRILIVGGGQTSVHLVQLAITKLRTHPSTITFLSRSALRSQPFDISLQWLSTRRYESLAHFWCQDPHHRAETLRASKGGSSETGASVDGECVDWLRSSGVNIREQCEVVSADWNGSAWVVEIWDESKCEEDEVACDFIWLATGNAVSFVEEPAIVALEKSLEECGLGIRVQGKLPVLNEDLSLKMGRGDGGEVGWEEEVGVHVLGAYAAMELGPGALNLMGARAGACRISRAIRHLNPKS